MMFSFIYPNTFLQGFCYMHVLLSSARLYIMIFFSDQSLICLLSDVTPHLIVDYTVLVFIPTDQIFCRSFILL